MKSITKIYIIVFTVVLASCSEKIKDNPIESSINTNPTELQLTDGQQKSIGLTIAKIEAREITNTIKANGMLDVPPQNMVTVSAILGGFVKKTELLQGMYVRKGQVIAVMEHPNYIQLQQDYLESKSLLDFYKAEYKRQQELAKENINAAKTLQQAQSNFQGTKAKAEGLRARLKMININTSNLEAGGIVNSVNIYAPISGYVTQVHVNIGQFVNPSDVLFKIVDTKHLHVEIVVFEKDALKIKLNQRVRFKLTNEQAERTAKVYLIGKEISAERTIRVHCHLEKEDETLIPGMYLSAEFEAGTGTVPSLPEQAIVNYENQNYVFLVLNETEKRYKMIQVNKGATVSGFSQVELPEGVDPASSFVVTGAYDLLGYLKNTEEE